MRLDFRQLVLACAASLIVLTSAVAQQSTLHGVVVGADGRPKAFARIQLQGEKQYAAVSDVNGTFTIENFAPGTYQANVRQNDNVQTLRVNISGPSVSLSVNW